jgi:hypothetical protein
MADRTGNRRRRPIRQRELINERQVAVSRPLMVATSVGNRAPTVREGTC